MEEIWKPIVCQDIKIGWYEVSNLGRVRHAKYKRLLSSFKSKGYMRIGLMTNDRGQQKFPVHRLVAIAFVEGYSEERHFVNHIDGNKFNNTPENLEWVTASENTIHAIKTGLLTIAHGEQNGSSKLREVDVHLICELFLDTGFNVPRTSELLNLPFEISKTNLYHIKNKEQWLEITDRYFFEEDTNINHPLHNAVALITDRRTNHMYASNFTRCSVYIADVLNVTPRSIHDKLINFKDMIGDVFYVKYIL